MITPREDRPKEMMAQRPAGVRVCVAGAGRRGAVVGMEVDFKGWGKRGAESCPFSLAERFPLIAPQDQTPLLAGAAQSVSVCVQGSCVHTRVCLRDLCVHRYTGIRNCM